jgi:MYXO-CTERM domain-containing protein
MKHTLMMAVILMGLSANARDNSGTTLTAINEINETVTAHNALVSMPKRDDDGTGVYPDVYDVPTSLQGHHVVDGGYVTDGGYVDDNDPMVGGCSSTTGNTWLAVVGAFLMLAAWPARRRTTS